MLYREIIAVYSEIHTKLITSPYRAVNALGLGCTNQSVNVV